MSNVDKTWMEGLRLEKGATMHVQTSVALEMPKEHAEYTVLYGFLVYFASALYINAVGGGLFQVMQLVRVHTSRVGSHNLKPALEPDDELVYYVVSS